MELFFFCSNDIFVCCKNKMRLRLVIYKISNYDSDKKSASMNFLQFEHRTSIASRPNRGNFYISREHDNRYWLLFFQNAGWNRHRGSRSMCRVSSGNAWTWAGSGFVSESGAAKLINVEMNALPQRYAHDVASAGVSPQPGAHPRAEGCPAEHDVTRALFGVSEIGERAATALSQQWKPQAQKYWTKRKCLFYKLPCFDLC